MDHTSFTEICLHQLKMSGVKEGERLVVLTQGSDRLAYADAQRLLQTGRRAEPARQGPQEDDVHLQGGLQEGLIRLRAGALPLRRGGAPA